MTRKLAALSLIASALVIAALSLGCATSAGETAAPPGGASATASDWAPSEPTSRPADPLPDDPTPGTIAGTLVLDTGPTVPASAVIFAQITDSRGSRVATSSTPISGSQPWPFSVSFDPAKVKTGQGLVLKVTVLAAHGPLYVAEFPLEDEGDDSLPSGIELMALPVE